jgi:glycosyltransferase involved in cell wall biosynthesis
MKFPALSVVIPLFNKGPHIGRAIDSVLRQSRGDFEIIVVNDGSTDNGPDVVRETGDRRIRLISQPNGGVSSARNRGVKEAASELIAFLDADDMWEPLFLETVLRLRQRHPEAGAYATAIRIRKPDLSEQAVRYRGIPEAPWEGLIPDYFDSVIAAPPVCASNVAIPKYVFDAVGYFPEGVSRGEDSDMWLRVALRYPIAFSRYVGGTYRQDSENRACNRARISSDPLILSTIHQALLSLPMPLSRARKLEAYHDTIVAEYSRALLLEGRRADAKRLLGKQIRPRRDALALKMLAVLPSRLLLLSLTARRKLKQRIRTGAGGT